MAIKSSMINRIVYDAVPETCPHVDKALETAAEAIKTQTGKLRDALTEWVERACEAEDSLDEANDTIAKLESRISELEAELADAI